jgi:hypothetical protein
MIKLLLISFSLMTLCVVIHAIGVMAALRSIHRSSGLDDPRFWRPTWLLIQVASWLVLMHLIEISIWALFYARVHAIPDMHSALYFSSVTYTTVGYGDLVLPEGWRLAGGIEALTGILMCGWSTGFFFTIVSRLYQARQAKST